jgi:hypothetical protein
MAQTGNTVVASAAPTADAAANEAALKDALSALQPTLAEVSSAVSNVELRRWKAPGEVKDTTASDIQSIQKDLNGTLPGLVTSAQGASGAVAPAFAVFRNIDALYDVMLRVTETATLAGSQQEAGRLEAARADLQTRRRQLGDALMNTAAAQDTNVIQLRSSLAAFRSAAAAPTPPGTPRKIVVNDGPDTTKAKPAHKRKPASTAPAQPASPQ